MKFLVILVSLSLPFLYSCTGNTVASDTTQMPTVWELGAPVEFTLPNLQKETAYNVYLDIRNTNEYPFSNLFLVTTLQYPNGKKAIDTLEYRMAAPNGQWLGTGLGSIKQIKLVFKEQLQFNEEGAYTLSITHAVRSNGSVEGVKNLEGISDVGYSIEKSDTH